MDSLLPDRIFRQALTLDGKRYTLVLELPPGREYFSGRMKSGPGNHNRGNLFGTDVLSVGVVDDESGDAFAKAAQSLAAGDLSARTGAPVRGRHDEMTELMRDLIAWPNASKGWWTRNRDC